MISSGEPMRLKTEKFKVGRFAATCVDRPAPKPQAVLKAWEELMKIRIALALGFFALMPAPASAQSQEAQNACMNDAFSVCGDAIPDRNRVAACLAKNIRRISPACRAAMGGHAKASRRATKVSHRARRKARRH